MPMHIERVSFVVSITTGIPLSMVTFLYMVLNNKKVEATLNEDSHRDSGGQVIISRFKTLCLLVLSVPLFY